MKLIKQHDSLQEGYLVKFLFFLSLFLISYSRLSFSDEDKQQNVEAQYKNDSLFVNTAQQTETTADEKQKESLSEINESDRTKTNNTAEKNSTINKKEEKTISQKRIVEDKISHESQKTNENETAEANGELKQGISTKTEENLTQKTEVSTDIEQSESEKTEENLTQKTEISTDIEQSESEKTEENLTQKTEVSTDIEQSESEKTEENLTQKTEVSTDIEQSESEKTEKNLTQKTEVSTDTKQSEGAKTNEDIQDTPEISDKKNIERIKITGSRIRQIDLESFSPVTVWTKEDIDNSGYLSLREFLNNTNLANFGFKNNIEVLVHNRSTLTLVNGARLVYNRAVDFIPLAAIERVEILKDGASALYGSDVVGGVINIITKKDYSSPEVSLKIAPSLYPLYKGGSQAEASLVFGKKFNKGHFISTFQFQYQDSLKAEQRKKWYHDSFQNFSTYPSFRIDKNNIIIDPRCPEHLREKEGPRVAYCKTDWLPYTYVFPKEYNFSNYNYAEYKINEVLFYTQWFGFFKSSSKLKRPILNTLKVPKGHKMSYGNGAEGKLKFIFEEFYKDEVTNNFFMDGLVGVKTYISKTWDMDLSFKWSNMWKNENRNNYPYTKDINNIINYGAYDPFDPSKRDISSVQIYNGNIYKDNDRKVFASMDFSGETLWNIDLALGLQAYNNRYKRIPNPEVKTGKIYTLSAVETGDSNRSAIAGYIEGVKNFYDKLTVQLAGRVDRYSDFGWTANPKLAFYFKPSNQFLIRSSIGTSFETPPLSSLNAPETTAHLRIYDTVACYNELKANGRFEEIYNLPDEESFSSKKEKDKLIRYFLTEQSYVTDNTKISNNVKKAFKGLTKSLGKGYCAPRSIRGKRKGNPNLKETKALSASLGFHWQITDDHSLEADGWFNSLKGRTTSSLNKKVFDTEVLYGKKEAEKIGGPKKRDSSSPYNSLEEGTPVETFINIAGKKLSGIDLKWESSFSNWSLGGGNLYFKDELAYIVHDETETIPGIVTSDVGEFGLPRWRNFAYFGWRNSSHDIALLLKSTAEMKKSEDEFEKIPAVHILDLLYKYNMDTKTTLRFGWRNFLFLGPVIDDSKKWGIKFHPDFYDIRGPHFFVELRKAL